MLSRSMSRMTSKSSLWTSWNSPNPTSKYDESVYRFPWLAREDEEGHHGGDHSDSQHLTSNEQSSTFQYSSPLPSLPETHYPEWPSTLTRQPYGRLNVSDLENEAFEVSPEGSVTDPEAQSLRAVDPNPHSTSTEDPNLVCYLVSSTQ
jgi:hypothetical protein